MKTRPILYSTHMVEAIMADRKTVTRRTRGLDPINETPNDWQIIYLAKQGIYQLRNIGGAHGDLFHAKCPYGAPGDLLYGRESYCYVMRNHTDLLEGMDSQIVFKTQVHPDWMEYAKEKYGYKWRPSIHMPKSAARIWQRITGVTLERLQDITEADAIAEGILPTKHLGQDGYFFYGFKHVVAQTSIAKESFRSLIDHINGPGTWHHNPWVWVVRTETLSKTGKPTI